MATSKPQFNVWLDPIVHKEIGEYVERSGVVKGKLVEQMWRFYNMKDLSLLVTKVNAMISRGLTDKEVSSLYMIMKSIERSLEDRLKQE